MFPDISYRLNKAAEKAGELVWEEGLLLKGNGLCHGIAGNAYFLHSLYRNNLARVAHIEDSEKVLEVTEKAFIWKARAYTFAMALFD